MITDEQRRWRLAHRHRLVEAERTDDIATITDDLVALHSSDPATVYLSAMVRMVSPSVDAVSAALYAERTVVRHHAMRRTIWVMTPRVARLAHGAATAKIARAERRRTLQAIEQTTDIADPEAWLDAATGEICVLLDREGPMSARAIGKALPHLAVPITMGAATKNPAALKAHTKVLQGAGFEAVLVRTAPTGTWNSAEYEWSSMESWVGARFDSLGEADAAAELLARWLTRFGPATTADIAWWFGWTAGLTSKTLGIVGAAQVDLEGGATGWLHPDDTHEVDDPGPWVRLLPGLDPTTMGWKGRTFYLDPADVAELYDRFGNGGPCVWADGRIVGAWGQRPDGEIVTELTQPIRPEHERLMATAVDELNAVLGEVVVRPRFPAPAQKRIRKAGTEGS